MDDFDALLEGVSKEDQSEELSQAKKRIETLESEKQELSTKLEAAFSEQGGQADSGKPLLLPIDDVIEDPDQPNVRQQRDKEFEAWLTENIRQQAKDGGTGVQDPISVRWSEQHEKWIINKGHTRHRCGKKADLKLIPAIVQDQHTDWNGVIENLIREGLTTKDMVAFIVRKKEEGFKQKDIAQRLSRDTGWVSKHMALANPPTFIQTLWDNGYATEFSILYGLLTAYKKDPEATEKAINEVIADKGKITYHDAQDLAKKIEKTKKNLLNENTAGQGEGSEGEQEEIEGGQGSSNPENPPTETKAKKPLVRLQVSFDKQDGFVLMREPEQSGHLVIELDSGGVIEVPIKEVEIIGMSAIEN
ncbi:ParB/RepB/Spo0J family partition protein [Gilvimarinus chinensis]|uniref:ParB/RepB/Spo0J family partition protein n=1 Tax=Gilvimarinus chinensis TaxID=396005 RepID=UPI000381ABDC|nr:ParB/RepB/Spo0J family partition protein [Gilvimarinus chinensis]